MKTIKAKISHTALTGFFLLLLASTCLAQFTNITSGGRFLHGTGTNEDYMSVVIPLSFEKGVELPALNTQIVGTDYFPWNATAGVLYHYNATNAASQTTTTGRIPFNEPIVGFGSRAGGSPLYFGQSYAFGFYAGSPYDYTNSLLIKEYRLSDGTLVNSTNFSIPDPTFNSAEWQRFVTNGYAKTLTAFGLTTTLTYDNPQQIWGIDISRPYLLIHTADATTAGYVFQIEFLGVTDKGYMALSSSSLPWWSRLYTVEFQAQNPWRSVFVDQPQFAGQPMPPSYDGKSVEEILTNPPPVTNTIALSPSACTSLDDSPELRRHPILDQFVSDMRNDPVALAGYVLNRIKLVNSMALNDSGTISDQSVNLGGVNRSALTTFVSGEGSPAEQCALLVYLLRQAGYPLRFTGAGRIGR